MTSGHGTAAARDERIGLLGLRSGSEDQMDDRLAAAGGMPRMIADARMGDSGMLGSSILIGERTEGAVRGDKWLVSSDVGRGGTMLRFPSDITRGESIAVKYDNWDGDIGASSKTKPKKG